MSLDEQLVFQFNSYDIIELSVTRGQVDPSKGVHISINSNISRFESNKIIITMTIKLSSRDDPRFELLRVISECVFESKEQVDDGSILNPKSISHLIKVSYDTTRGVLLEKLSNTNLNRLVLPLANSETLGIRETT